MISHSNWITKSDGLVPPGTRLHKIDGDRQICRLSGQEKELEILVLRQQLAILHRKYLKPLKPHRPKR